MHIVQLGIKLTISQAETFKSLRTTHFSSDYQNQQSDEKDNFHWRIYSGYIPEHIVQVRMSSQITVNTLRPIMSKISNATSAFLETKYSIVNYLDDFFPLDFCLKPTDLPVFTDETLVAAF